MSAKLGLMITLCLILQLSLSTQVESLAQQGKRNLAAYDKSGPYFFDNEPPWERRERMAGEIREFLWEHWKERRLGLVKATFFSIEGDLTSSTFFVEPSAKGHWRIVVESESIISSLLPKKRKPRPEINRDYYNLVDRVDPTSDKLAPSIPEDEVRQPQTYRLRLKNRQTNSVRIF